MFSSYITKHPHGVYFTKLTILIILIGCISLTLDGACNQKDEPTKAQKPVAPQKTTTDLKTVQVYPGVEKPQSDPSGPQKQEPVQAKPKKHHPAPAEPQPDSQTELSRALTSYLTQEGDDPTTATPRQTFLIDLNGDGRLDALVLLRNPYWCGTGGCTMLVFKGTFSGFEFVSHHPLVHSPVIVSENQTKEWRDLVVMSSGGGLPPTLLIFKFTGTEYHLDSSTLPGLPPNHPVKGTKVF